MRTLRRLHALRLCVVLALAVVVTLGAVVWFRMSRVEAAPALVQQHAPTSYRPVPMQRTQPPTALFVGDDFTARYEGIGSDAYTYPYIVCDLLGLNCNVDAQIGTGFINDGRNYSTENSRLIDRLPRDSRVYDANLVIIDAGRNDIEAGVEAYGKGLEQYLREVERFWPAAKVVVIAPAYLSAEPYPEYGDVISIIGRILESFNGVLIDPVAERWYDGVDVSTIQLSDQIHPNQAGNRLIAEKLAESLLVHGLVELRSTS